MVTAATAIAPMLTAPEPTEAELADDVVVDDPNKMEPAPIRTFG